MPNWCGNNVTIYGDRKTVTTLADTLLGSDWLFRSVVPCSEPNIERHIECWGTQWDVPTRNVMADLESTGTSPERFFSEDRSYRLHLRFSTAWTPCIKFLRTVSNKYGVVIHLAYEDSGMKFAGTMLFTPNYDPVECVVDLPWEYHYDSEDNAFLDPVTQAWLVAHNLDKRPPINY